MSASMRPGSGLASNSAVRLSTKFARPSRLLRISAGIVQSGSSRLAWKIVQSRQFRRNATRKRSTAAVLARLSSLADSNNAHASVRAGLPGCGVVCVWYRAAGEAIQNLLFTRDQLLRRLERLVERAFVNMPAHLAGKCRGAGRCRFEFFDELINKW